MSADPGVAVVDKTLDVLECLLDRPDLSVAEISRAAGVTKAAAYRILATLERRGYVSTFQRVRRYSIGQAFHSYVAAVRQSDRLLNAARPVMEHLWRASEETVNLGIMARRSVLYLDTLESPQGLRATTVPGSLDALHCTALGKAILSRLPAAEQQALISGAVLERRTRNTATSIAQLEELIGRTLATGWAVDDEENEMGMRCVAAPIVNADGRPLAAISVSGPSSRMTDEAIAKIGASLVAACAAIGRQVAGLP